jgi:hypothetical protein
MDLNSVNPESLFSQLINRTDIDAEYTKANGFL